MANNTDLQLSEPLNIIYRASLNPKVAPVEQVANGPLTLTEIDGNMRAIADRFAVVKAKFDEIASTLNDKANASNPEFTGYISVPVVEHADGIDAPEGTIVYDLSAKSLAVCVYKKTSSGKEERDWQNINTDTGLSGYLSTRGGTVTGQVVFERDVIVHKGIITLPPGATDQAALEQAATSDWTISQIEKMINDRVGSTANYVVVDHVNADNVIVEGSKDSNGIILRKGHIEVQSGNINVPNGNVTAVNLYGNIDLGTLD